jgi:hypothetical protein
MTVGTLEPQHFRTPLLLMTVAIIGALIWLTGGCSASSGEQMPVIEPAPLTLDGQLEFADGSVIDLKTGLFLAGGEGKVVRRMDLDLDGGVLVDGSPQMMRVEYRSNLHGDWVRCGRVEFDVMNCTVTFPVPLHDSCAKGDIAVSCRPFRVKAADEPPTVEPI